LHRRQNHRPTRAKHGTPLLLINSTLRFPHTSRPTFVSPHFPFPLLLSYSSSPPGNQRGSVTHPLYHHQQDQRRRHRRPDLTLPRNRTIARDFGFRWIHSKSTSLLLLTGLPANHNRFWFLSPKRPTPTLSFSFPLPFPSLFSFAIIRFEIRRNGHDCRQLTTLALGSDTPQSPLADYSRLEQSSPRRLPARPV
jgi:hypothetical protein